MGVFGLFCARRVSVFCLILICVEGVEDLLLRRDKLVGVSGLFLCSVFDAEEVLFKETIDAIYHHYTRCFVDIYGRGCCVFLVSYF